MWPWRKEFWDMPIKTLAIWIGIAFIFYVTFLLGVDYGKTNQTFYTKIVDGLSKPFGCGAAAPPPQAPPSPSVDYYTILVNQFPTEDLAINFRTKLASERINSRVMPHGGSFYVVVGKFTSFGQAQGMQRKMAEKGYPGASILSPVN